MDLVDASLRADTLKMIGCFTAAAINCKTFCTAAEDQTCELSMQLPLWNELLFPARLHLREVPGVRSQLSLASYRMWPRFEDPPFELVEKAWACAYFLLKSHHCIVAFHLSLEGFGNRNDLLFEALRGNSSVKYLKISHYTPVFCEGLSTILSSMNCLQELELKKGKPSSELETEISTLLRSTVSLRVLRIQQLKLHGGASVLLEALFANTTLSELSLNESILNSVGRDYRQSFEKYLEESTTLTTLNFVGGKPCQPKMSSLSAVLNGMLRNKTIRKLSLKNIPLVCKSTRLINKLIKATECLRCFRLHATMGTSVPQCCDRPDKHSNWMFALARSKALEEVTLPMSSCNAVKWRLFFEVLSSNANTMKVTIEPDCESRHIRVDFCTTIREIFMDDRVSFSRQVVVEDLEVLKCKALSRVSVLPAVGWPILDELLSCGHITCVRLLMPVSINEALFTAVADYIKTTTTLRELCLHMVHVEDPQEELRCWTIFATSLSRNASIRKVGIYASFSNKNVTELLADAVMSRKNTWRVELGWQPCVHYSVFIQRFSMGITGNFTLLDVTLNGYIPMEVIKNWFLVDDTVRRNFGLLTRAAQFASGVLRDRWGAQALERMHCHAALPEELMQAASVESSEAASMIRRALCGIEGIHDFMRLSGVVRERVVCLPRQDGRPQLDDLDEYTWIAVRRYLLLEDVRSGRP